MRLIALAFLSLLPLSAQLTTPSTTLTAPITINGTGEWCLGSGASVVLPSNTSGTSGSFLLIDREAAQVQRTGSNSNCFVVKRGQLGSSASVSHSTGSTVWIGQAANSSGDPSRPLNGAFVAFVPSGSCVAADQYTLPVVFTGPVSAGAWFGTVINCTNGQWTAVDPGPQIPELPFYLSADYNFLVQSGSTVTGDLSVVGTNTVQFAPCPSGVAGTNTYHYLRISGFPGADESALITGGTCTSGAATGTIRLTTANSHSTQWTIGSATLGIQEAIWVVPSTGGTILTEPGTQDLNAPVSKRAIPIFVVGAGQDVTTFNVPTSFSLSYPGVFVMPDDLPVYNTALITSGGYSDFTVKFTQPDSNNLSTYTHWPPAFYGYRTSRPSFERLTIVAGWDGIKVIGYNGVEISDVNSSCFHHGLELDQHVDASHIYNFHSWVFGLTALQNQPFLYNPDVYSMYIGKADDLQIIGYGGIPAIKFLDSWSGVGPLGGGPWATITNSDMDSGGVIFDSQVGGKLRISTSFIGAASGTDSAGLHLRIPITYTGKGELDISDSWIGFSSADLTAANSPIIDVDFSDTSSPTDQGVTHVTLRGNRIYSTGDHRFIYAHTTGSDTGTVAIHENRIVAPDAIGVSFTNPIISAVGTVRVTATGNVMNDKFSGSGAFFSGTVDMGHLVANNTISNWSITYPAVTATSIYKDNVGVTNGIPWASNVASASDVVPSGTYFHITGTALIANFVQTAASGSNTVSLNELNIVFDAAASWTTGGNIAAVGTATPGTMYRWVWDPTTSKWYTNN